MRLKLLDLAAIAVALGVIALFSVAAYGGEDRNPTVVIEADGSSLIYPLAIDRQVTVSGPLGEELVAIQAGKAFVVSSPCPNKICIAQGKISRPGQWIACLPNRVFIHVEGRTARQVDDTSY